MPLSRQIHFVPSTRTKYSRTYYRELTNDGKKRVLGNIISSEKKEINNCLNPDVVRIEIVDMARVSLYIINYIFIVKNFTLFGRFFLSI